MQNLNIPFYFAGFNPEIMIPVLILVVILFGGKKIPELMRGVGRGMGELQKGIAEGRQHLEEAAREEPKPAATTPAESTQPRDASTSTTP